MRQTAELDRNGLAGGRYESAHRLELAQRVHECQVEGCSNLAMDRRYCNRCWDEIESLRCNAAEREEWRAGRRERWQRRFEAAIEAWLVFWDWLGSSKLVDAVLAVFVVAGWLYFCFVCGATFFGFGR